MSYYIEIPIMIIMYVGWKLVKKSKIVPLAMMDLETDVHTKDDNEDDKWENEKSWKGKAHTAVRWIF